MRLAFLGTPAAAVPTLRALVAAGHDVAMVVTRPDRRRGRGAAVSHSDVQVAAQELGLRVGHAVGDLADVDVERGVVVAYGALVPAAVLARTPMLNVHFSLLPRWRGAAPVERAILAGDEETGVSVMSLEATLDTGPIHLVRRVSVDEKRASELTAELADVGAQALVDVLASPALLEHPTPQEGEVTYADKLRAETFHLEPSMSVDEFSRVVRLERGFTILSARRLRVLEVQRVDEAIEAGRVGLAGGVLALGVRDGAVALRVVQAEGGRPVDGYAWWQGARLNVASARWA